MKSHVRFATGGNIVGAQHRTGLFADTGLGCDISWDHDWARNTRVYLSGTAKASQGWLLASGRDTERLLTSHNLNNIETGYQNPEVCSLQPLTKGWIATREMDQGSAYLIPLWSLMSQTSSTPHVLALMNVEPEFRGSCTHRPSIPKELPSNIVCPLATGPGVTPELIHRSCGGYQIIAIPTQR